MKTIVPASLFVIKSSYSTVIRFGVRKKQFKPTKSEVTQSTEGLLFSIEANENRIWNYDMTHRYGLGEDRTDPARSTDHISDEEAR